MKIFALRSWIKITSSKRERRARSERSEGVKRDGNGAIKFLNLQLFGDYLGLPRSIEAHCSVARAAAQWSMAKAVDNKLSPWMLKPMPLHEKLFSINRRRWIPGQFIKINSMDAREKWPIIRVRSWVMACLKSFYLVFSIEEVFPGCTMLCSRNVLVKLRGTWMQCSWYSKFWGSIWSNVTN